MGSMHETPALGLGSLVSGLREVYKSGRTRELAWRRSQLKGLIRLLTEKEEEIFDVLRHDLGKHRTESFRDEVRTYHYLRTAARIRVRSHQRELSSVS